MVVRFERNGSGLWLDGKFALTGSFRKKERRCKPGRFLGLEAILDAATFVHFGRVQGIVALPSAHLRTLPPEHSWTHFSESIQVPSKSRTNYTCAQDLKELKTAAPGQL